MLLEAAQVATVLGHATGIIDKIYSRFFEVKTGSPPSSGLLPEHAAIIRNDPDQEAIVSLWQGNDVARVTYSELGQRLSAADIRYIQAREKIMSQLYDQWEAAELALVTETDPIRAVKVKQQSAGVTDDLGKQLSSVLGFLEKMGLSLDDHYHVFRDLANK